MNKPEIKAALDKINSMGLLPLNVNIKRKPSIIYTEDDYQVYIDDVQLTTRRMTASEVLLFLEGLSVGIIVAKGHRFIGSTSEAGS